MKCRYDKKKDKFLINILSNAIKYTNNNGEINIKLYDDISSVYISVRDNGTEFVIKLPK
ncbi:MAG: ATP-binding protein [Romboutsia sp.]